MTEFLINGEDYLSKFKDFKLIGRDNELDTLMSTLLRKRANSVLVVGPSGVGATALIVGLQEKKNDINAPFDIAIKNFFWLDVDGLFSLGDNDAISKSFNAAMAHLRDTSGSVLVIEDSGDFFEACRNAGTGHFINMINGYVKDGKIQVVMEVSDKDLGKVLSWHSDLVESYTKLDLREPIGDSLVKILQAAAKKIGDYHAISIDAEAVQIATELTLKYRIDGGLGMSQPQRAINLMDRALSRYRMVSHQKPPHIEALVAEGKVAEAAAAATKYSDVKAKLSAIQKKIFGWSENAHDNNLKIEELREVEKAKQVENKDSIFTGVADTQAIRDLLNMNNVIAAEVKKAKEEYTSLSSSINEGLVLTRKEVMEEFSTITGISISKLGEDEKEILRNLETTLRKHVFGQDHVLEKMTNAIKVSRVGKRNKSRPQASFMLLGPSGTGKCLAGDQKIPVMLPDYLVDFAIEKGYLPKT